MISTRAALQDVATALSGAGLDAAIDPRDLTVPGVWVQRVTVTPDLLCAGAYTLRVRMMCVSPDVGTWDALDHLDNLQDAAMALFPANTGAGTTDRTVLLPDSATAYPATFWDVDLQVT